MKKYVYLHLLRALAVAGFLGGVGSACAADLTTPVVVSDKDQVISDNIAVTDTDTSGNTAYALSIGSGVSGGTISVNSQSLSGDFTANKDGTNALIYVKSGYTGTVKTGDNLQLHMVGHGSYFSGMPVYVNSQTSSDVSSTADAYLSLGNNVSISGDYQEDANTSTYIGLIHNNGAHVSMGDNLQLDAGVSGASQVLTYGLVNTHMGQMTGGDNTSVNINATGLNGATMRVAGIYSGFDNTPDISSISNSTSDTSSATSSQRERLTMGNHTTVNVQLSGDSTGTNVNAAGIYLTDTDLKLGDYTSSSITSNAFSTDIMGFQTSHSTGDVGSHFTSSVTVTGASQNAEALSAVNSSSLTFGEGSQLSVNTSTGGDSSHSFGDVSGVLSRSNSSVTFNGKSTLDMDVTGNTNVINGYYADNNSQVSTGDGLSMDINASGGNLAVVRGIYSFSGSDITAGDDASITINADSQNVTYLDNTSQVSGINAAYGTVHMGNNLTTQVNASNFNEGYGLFDRFNSTMEIGDNADITLTHNGNSYTTAGAYVYNSNLTAGDNLALHVNGTNSSSSTSSMAAGLVSGYGTVNIGDNFQIDMDVSGYAEAIGINGYGHWYYPTFPNTINIGDNLNIHMTGDNTMSYGLYNTETSWRYGNVNNVKTTTTTIGDNATIKLDSASSVGIYTSGQPLIVTLGDNADVEAGLYGVLNQYGGITRFTGAASITGGTYSMVSMDTGSLIDLSASGRKRINGSIMTSYGGSVDLTMDTADSLFTGASLIRNDNGTVDIDMSNGARWLMTGDSTVTTLSNNSGATVDMRGNSAYQTLTAGTFSGNDGVFVMKTDLDSQQDGDKVYITTADEGSSGQISVYDQSLVSGNMVTGTRHLLLVTDESENAVFTGKTLDTGGLWDVTPTIENGSYVRDVMGDANAKDTEWYLTKIEKKVNEDTHPLIYSGDNDYGLYRLSIDTLRQRLGDLRYHDRDEDNWDFWARNRNGRFEGSGYDSKYNFFQMGADRMPNKNSAYGFFVERGIASPDYDTGSGKNHSLAGALYGTWIGDHGSYTDVVARIGRDDVSINTYGEYPDHASYRSHEKSLSVEYGKTRPWGDKGYFYEPQVQLVAGHLGSDHYTTSRGTRVSIDSYNSLIGRAGIVIGKKKTEGERPYDYYLKVSVLHEFGGDRDYSLRAANGESLSDNYNYRDTWVEAGLGGTVRLNENTYAYADVERSFSSDYTKKWQWNVGINWSF